MVSSEKTAQSLGEALARHPGGVRRYVAMDARQRRALADGAKNCKDGDLGAYVARTLTEESTK